MFELIYKIALAEAILCISLKTFSFPEEESFLGLDILKKALNETVLSIDSKNFSDYDEIISKLVEVFFYVKNVGGTVYFVGNGGSAAISMHMTTDFFKNGGMRTHSMHDPTVLTCLANDFGYENVFSKQLEMNADEGDMLVAISSSGESPNILQAINGSGIKGRCKIVTFSGFNPNNSLRKLGDLNLHVPSMQYGIVESIHNMILQDVVDSLKCRKED